MQKSLAWRAILWIIMNMKLNYILHNSGVSVFDNGKHFTISEDSHNYRAVIKAIQANDRVALQAALQETELSFFRKVSEAAGFVFDGDDASLDNLPIVGPLAAKLARMNREGFDLAPFVKFVRNLRSNPSHAAQVELYDFLSYSELPITEDGEFLAYKGVQDDYFSCTSGNITLLKGKVRNGRIDNSIGEEIECTRNQVDDDRRKHCSNGLHVGSHDYATTFGSRTVVVKVNPRDVVSIPDDCSCQKARVCAYTVVADYVGEVEAAVVDRSATPVANTAQALAEKVGVAIKRLLKRGGKVTLKRLQSALPVGLAGVVELRNAARNAGYTVAVNPDAPASVGAMLVF